MIRKYCKDDEDAVIRIWLEASYIAHDFILQSYWKSEVEEIRKSYVPSSETYVYDHYGEVTGFISVVNNAIMAVFVSPSRQRRGVGKSLLDYIKSGHGRLCVRVSPGNAKAIKFYESQGFKEKRTLFDKENGREEITLEYKNKR